MTNIKDINGNVLFECDSDNLRDCVLEALKSKADLRGADLRWADLCWDNLHGADLHGSDLRGAHLHGSDLRGADLHGADLRWADLYWANLHGADLHGSDLRWADLHGSDLRWADLHGADLRWVDLRGAENIPYIPLACPSDGEFTAWKKVGDKLVKLLIPEDARRSSATTNKCRCDRAVVLAITGLNERETFDKVINNSYSKLTYEVGKEVIPDSYDENRWNECSNGIHFFINKQDAINY